MLTIHEYSLIVNEIKKIESAQETKLLELLLKYTDLSSEDEEYIEELEKEFYNQSSH